MSSPPVPPDRLWRLDVLRAAAVLLVVGFHSGYGGAGLFQPLALAMRVWNRCGWIGVDLFFVLSGFLVSGLLFREWLRYGQIRVGRFFIRRGLKIYPAFYVYLAVVVAFLFAHGLPIPIGTLLSEVFFVQNYGSRFLVHTWSLAVEEHFYVLLAFGFFFAGPRIANRAVVVRTFLAVAAGCLALRLMSVFVWGIPETRDATHLRIDSLLAGVLIAYAFYFQPARLAALARWGIWLLVGCAVLIAPVVLLPQTHPFVQTAGLTMLYLAFGGFVIVAVDRGTRLRSSPGWVLAALAYVGRHSYSIYLWHLPLRIWGPWRSAEQLGDSLLGAVQFAIYVIAAVAVGILMSALVEFPVLRIRDRLLPSRAAGPIQK